LNRFVLADTAYLGEIFPRPDSPPSSAQIQALLAVWAALAETDCDGLDVIWNVQQALKRTVRWLKILITPIPEGLGKERRRKGDDIPSSSFDYVRHISSWRPVVPSGLGSWIANNGLEATESSRSLLTDESSVEGGENRSCLPLSRPTPPRTISSRNKMLGYYCLACIGTIALTVFGMKIWVSSGRRPIRQLLGLALTRAIQWNGKSVFLFTMGGRESTLVSNATIHNATVNNASIHNATLNGP
jgi:hypothetical protein